MKASLAIMRLISGDPNFPTDKDEIVRRIGAQIGAIEETIELGPLYSDALVVRVVSAEPIAGSDHLSLCQIDDKQTRKDVARGADGLIQVVCGAPNVKAKQLAVWLPPGSVVPSSAHSSDPFILTNRKIMDFVSNGMLASASELAISNDHDGIVTLPEKTDYGVSLSSLLNLDDTVVDIENKMFTHRPDLFGQLGIAREISAVFNQPFKSPNWYRADNTLTAKPSGNLSVDNQLLSTSCQRFMVVAIDKLSVEPSPLWLQSYLSRSGIRPLNNIVDVTNYVMLLTGQPLHAYDLAKVGDGLQAEIVVRNPLANETLSLLDGSQITLNKDDIVIANRSGAIGLGGVMGGQDSEISESTTAIVLECASFDMYRIRRSSMAHGIFSEAVTRFNKGPSPLQCPPVLAYAYSLLKEVCPEAELASEVVDSKNDAALEKFQASISLDLKTLKTYLGVALDPNEVITLLSNAELEASLEGETISVRPAFWRTDLSAPVDLIEEIARLHGFDNLPINVPLRPLTPPEASPLQQLKRQLRRALVAAGANEVLSYSFINRALLEAAGQDPVQAFKISNALSPELEYYRLSLAPSLLAKVHPNLKAGFERFSLFEIGKTHLVNQLGEDGLPTGAEHLALAAAADAKSAKLHYQGDAYYHAKTYLEYLLGSLQQNSQELEYTPLKDANLVNEPFFSSAAQTYSAGRSAVVSLNKSIIGLVGEYNQKATRSLKLPPYCAGFELDLNSLLTLINQNTSPAYSERSRFPRVVQDLTVPSNARSYAEIVAAINKSLKKQLPPDVSYKLYPIDSYLPKDEANNSFWTFRLESESFERTLTDKEIATVIEQLKSDLN